MQTKRAKVLTALRSARKVLEPFHEDAPELYGVLAEWMALVSGRKRMTEEIWKKLLVFTGETMVGMQELYRDVEVRQQYAQAYFAAMSACMAAQDPGPNQETYLSGVREGLRGARQSARELREQMRDLEDARTVLAGFKTTFEGGGNDS